MSKEDLIGASCQDLVKHIVQINPFITRVSFQAFYYEPQSTPERKIYPDIHYKVGRDELLNGELGQLIDGLPPGYDLGILSRVGIIVGPDRHIPMMDFNLAKSPENIVLLKERLAQVTFEKDGFIVESGKSYHYYGAKLLDEADWRQFLARCLLTSFFQGADGPFLQVADCRYIGYRMLDGACCLRLTTNAQRKFLPRVVDIL